MQLFMFTYFVYIGFSTNDGQSTELSVVNEIPFKLDSLDNINTLSKRLMEELNKKLLLNGLTVVSVIIKNFILINQSEEKTA